MGGRKRLTTQEFIELSKEIHGDKYDYSLVEYKSAHVKVKIICPIHGIFEQEPNDHKRGFGCRKCAGTQKLTNDEFIQKAKEIHGDKYDYSKVNYKNANTKIKILCPKHGMFKQTPYKHLLGQGCSTCANNIPYTTKQFIEKVKEKHKNKYDYSLVNYERANIKIKIMCPLHGIFKQKAYMHLKGNGCPQCKESKGEKIIRKYLESNNINFIYQKTFNNCKNKKLLPFDFYVPYKNLLIEYDGIQHFKVINYFGGRKGFQNLKKNDEIKNKFAKENNIKLLRIPYYQFNNIISKLDKIIF